MLSWFIGVMVRSSGGSRRRVDGSSQVVVWEVSVVENYVILRYEISTVAKCYLEVKSVILRRCDAMWLRLESTGPEHEVRENWSHFPACSHHVHVHAHILDYNEDERNFTMQDMSSIIIRWNFDIPYTCSLARSKSHQAVQRPVSLPIPKHFNLH